MKLFKQLGLAAIALAASLGPANAQAPVEITIAHVLSERSFYHVAGMKLKELVEARTGGRARVNVQCCGALGNEGRLIQSVRTGVIDMVFHGLGSLEGTVPEYRVLSLPHIFDNHAQAERVLRGPLGDRILKLVEPHGMIGLAFGAIFERNMATRDKPITKVEDMRGVKVRVLQTPAWVLAYQAVGAQPTPMPYGEVFISMQNGVVDGAELSADAMVADRFIEVAKHFSLTRFHQSTSMFVASKARFDALPADVRDAIRAALPEAVRAGLEFHARLNEDGMNQMRARGITITEPDLAPFRDVTRRSWEQILNDAGPNGRTLVQEIEAAKKATN
jgi:tripartite ATP-independent transporter DctP family solute receptor